jgi:hypothetical protein
MADDTFPIANHHFEAAGIPVDDTPDVQKDTTNEVDTQGTEPKTDEGQAPEVSVSEGEATPATNSTSSGTNGDAKPKQEEKAPVANRPETELDQENYSELVNGKPVRPEVAGRWYHQRNTARQERDMVNAKYTETTQKVTQLEAQVEAYKTATASISALAPAEIPHAVKVYNSLKTNPVGTLKQMLAEAKANGHNIDGIGEGIDTAAIQRMLDQKLEAFVGKNNQGQPQAPTQAPTVDNDDDLFVQAYPDAKHHMDVYLEMLNKNPRLSNTELYFTAKNWADANGYDYSKPLKPQILARTNPNQQQPAAPQPKTDNVTPRLNGKGETVPEPLLTPGGKEESFKEIIAKALKENPLQ